uniref:Predicted protein n=1 Tax=Hordeum vulgare subsp. vulgare TaxID=112509 RepID=F2CRU8_HORVV|nr:predicted protein [Hordeum vulgare subsp. vulgare]BAJ92469.1 predicted protein [Hordeum vulgare subsp. vulgare]
MLISLIFIHCQGNGRSWLIRLVQSSCSPRSTTLVPSLFQTLVCLELIDSMRSCHLELEQSWLLVHHNRQLLVQKMVELGSSAKCRSMLLLIIVLFMDLILPPFCKLCPR